MSLKKRFIAGAVCPKCSGMDCVRLWQDEEGISHMDCVDCGYTSRIDSPPEPPQAMPASKSDQREARQKAIKQQTVQFVKNPRLNRKK